MQDNKPRRHLMTRKEAAHRLGLSENTLAKWASAGCPNLPFFMIGSRARYDAAELDGFIESHRRTLKVLRKKR